MNQNLTPYGSNTISKHHNTSTPSKMSAPAPGQDRQDTPIRSSLLLALTTQSVLLSELFASLPTGGNDVPALHSSLVASAANLDALSREAEAHQVQWAALLAQKAQVEALERKVRGLVRELERERVELEEMVDEGRKIVQSMDKAESSALIDSPLTQIQRASRYSWRTPMRSRGRRPRRPLRSRG